MSIRIFLVIMICLLSGSALAQDKSEPTREPTDRTDLNATMLSATEIRAGWQEIAAAIALTGQENTAAKLEESVEMLSDEDLVRIYGKADVTSMLDAFMFGDRATEAVDHALGNEGKSIKDSLASLDQGLSGTAAINDSISTIMSAGFPDATGYPGGACPSSPNRTDANALLNAVDGVEDARLALEIAQGIWSPLSRACDEIIVVLGEGFNTSLACIPVDIALFAAELVVGNSESAIEQMWHCNDAVNSAEIEGIYDRSGHLHTDLVNHDIDISNQLNQHDIDISNQLTQHDIDISNQLAQHDADIKALLATLQETVEENQRLIKISMSRQLEVMKLLVTPEGQRAINPQVLTCTGDDCPQVFDCPTGDFSWNSCR